MIRYIYKLSRVTNFKHPLFSFSAGYMAVQAALPVDLLGRKYNESGTGAMVTSLGIAHAMLHPVTGKKY